MLSALDGHGLRFVPPAGTPADVVSTQVALAAAELEAIVGASSMHGADRRVAQAARAEARLQAVKLSESVAIVAQEVAANAELLSKGYVSKLRFLELQRQQSALIRDRDIAFETSRKADAQIAFADGTLRQADGDARARVLNALAKSETEVRLRREELVRVRHRTGLQRLVSPIDGMVSQLAVHTVGGVIELAKPIMVVVPSAGRLIGQVKIPTRDAGFVRVGQPVAVKLAAFPFTRYGTARGRVESISPDSIHDETLGLVFIARIAVERRISGRGGEPIALTPGMEITADIRTGRRSIMNFLVSPLQDVLLKAGRER
jgi:hemolysin D